MNKLPEINNSESGGIIIIGAGNWGTTLALLLAPHRRTRLWTRSRKQADDIAETGENKQYLPSVSLPEALEIEPFGATEPDSNDLFIIAVPSHQVRTLCEQLDSVWTGQIIVNSAKGFEHHTMKTLSQVIEDILVDVPLVVWSGPNIASEMAQGKPTRAILAGNDMSVLSRTARMLRNDRVSFEISRDIRGVELCASLKGILAITLGISDGLNLGDNFAGLLLTYGLKEFSSIAEFMGIPKDTIYGIAGLGDCFTSSMSPHGRNRRFGRLVAQDIPPEEAIHEVGMVVEGVQMLRTITELEDLNVPIPLFSAVKRIIFAPNGNIREIIVDTVMSYNTHIPHKIFSLEGIA